MDPVRTGPMLDWWNHCFSPSPNQPSGIVANDSDMHVVNSPYPVKPQPEKQIWLALGLFLTAVEFLHHLCLCALGWCLWNQLYLRWICYWRFYHIRAFVQEFRLALFGIFLEWFCSYVWRRCSFVSLRLLLLSYSPITLRSFCSMRAVF